MLKNILLYIKNILLYIWQLPQNLLALLLMLVYRPFLKKPEISDYKGVKYVWYKNWPNGVSLGHYVLIGTYYENRLETINHEYGHTRQSLIFGPLYLLIIGLPSISGNIYDRIRHQVDDSWTYKRSSKWYYSQPWEKGADVLGNVERHFD